MVHRKPFAPFFQESLKIVSCCPLCETHYDPLEARVVEQRDGVHLIHVQCRKCLSSVIVLVSSGQSGMLSVSMLTDLTADDVARFRASERVTCDDVLNFHEMLGTTPAENLFVRA